MSISMAGTGVVDTVLASAGTGKTTALVGRIVEAVLGGVEPERIVATTYTRRAAAELHDRVQRRLLDVAGAGTAMRLEQAWVGTLHAVCGRLCREFAFALGISPGATVGDEDVARSLFATAAACAVARSAPALNAIAESFGMPDWRDDVLRIVECARANAVDAAGLGESARQSVETLLALLAPAARDGDRLDATLRRAAEDALPLPPGRTPRASSRGAEATLRAARATLAQGNRLPWPAWAALASPNCARADEALFADVARAAAAHGRHPRLRADVERFVTLAFACAGEAMQAYADLKAERGLLDFGDVEVHALRILQDPGCRGTLQERIGFVAVDETQDASPMQLCILNELAEIAERSVWAGDPKQSIFSFRSTDPALTLAAARGAVDTGGRSVVLSTSWRSRPGIREFVADCFVPAFGELGLQPGEVAFDDGGRPDLESDVPALHVWQATCRGRKARAAAVAAGVARALADGASWPVASPEGTRALRAGDVAVLCRGNRDVEAVAAALDGLGVPVAVERGGLMDTAACQLLHAACRWMHDRTDRLALVELARIAGAPRDETAWLNALGEDDPIDALVGLLPFAPALDALRASLRDASVPEAVDAVLLSGGMLDAAVGLAADADAWSTLEAMRRLAGEFEDGCRRDSRTSTLGGFNRWVVDRQPAQPRSARSDAVAVLTYHRAKGLEWPMCVLDKLDAQPRSSAFGVTAEADGVVDWRRPLAGRWVRYWPWPYGRRWSGVPLASAAGASDVGRRAHALAREEALRLLYVGATRPRDHLVLVGSGDRDLPWLGVLDVGAGRHVVLPKPGQAQVMVGGVSHRARCVSIAPASPGRTSAVADAWASATLGSAAFPPRRITPSATEARPGARVVARHRLGARLPLAGTPDMMLLGQALHAFLAADQPGDVAGRMRMAGRVLEGWRMSAHVQAADMLAMADGFWEWVGKTFPGHRMRREATVHAPRGAQAVVGRVDLLLEGGDGFAVVDHKAFPAEVGQVRAERHSFQLAAYAEAVHAVTGLKCSGTYLHLPVSGQVLRVEVSGRRTAPDRFGTHWQGDSGRSRAQGGRHGHAASGGTQRAPGTRRSARGGSFP